LASKQNEILEELQRRIETVENVNLVLRNPKVPPHSDSYPAVSIITRNWELSGATKTGANDELIYTKAWEVWIVFYYVADDTIDDDQAESEVWDAWDSVREAIYTGGTRLVEGAMIQEISGSTPLKPYVGEPGIALATEFAIDFIDDTSKL